MTTTLVCTWCEFMRRSDSGARCPRHDFAWMPAGEVVVGDQFLWLDRLLTVAERRVVKYRTHDYTIQFFVEVDGVRKGLYYGSDEQVEALHSGGQEGRS